MKDLNIDARSLSSLAQEEKRKLAIRLRKEEKLSYPKIAELVGVHPLTVGHWVRAYERQGFQASVPSPKVAPNTADVF